MSTPELLELITRKVCIKLDVEPAATLKDGRGKRDITDAKNIISYLALKYCPSGPCSIGQKIGRDHSVVIFRKNACEALISSSKPFKKLVDSIESELYLN